MVCCVHRPRTAGNGGCSLVPRALQRLRQCAGPLVAHQPGGFLKTAVPAAKCMQPRAVCVGGLPLAWSNGPG